MVNRTVKVIVLSSIAFAIATAYFYMSKEADVKTIRIGNSYIQVEIADFALAQARGLSGRGNLGQNSGMLFVFKDKRTRNFWMKDMRFDIDALWIDQNQVIGMLENIPFEPKNGQITGFQSKVPVDMVLEVNAGWIAKNGIKIGDLASIDTN